MVDPIECARLWLPEQVCQSAVVEKTPSLALVGWANVGLKSVDLVVAAACPVADISHAVSRQFQEGLDAAEAELPPSLRAAKLCVMGLYLINLDSDREEVEGGNNNVARRRAEDECDSSRRQEGSDENLRRGVQLGGGGDGSELNHSTRASLHRIANVWAVLSARKSTESDNELRWIPYVHHLSLEGSQALVKEHIIIYQQPVFGSHHFSSLQWSPSHEFSACKSSSQNRRNPSTIKRPQWLTELGKHHEAPDLETVMVELNCATFIDDILKNLWSPAGFSCRSRSAISSFCHAYFWRPVAGLVAIWSTMLYILARVLVLVLAVWSPALPYLSGLLQKSMTWQAMHIRCQQLMAWPVILLWGGLGPEQPNAAAAHNLRIARNSVWSVLLVDNILGAIAAYLVFQRHAAIMELAVHAGQALTNDVLRAGCVWFMGVPAGFKLNNELAAAIGTLSLHVIQSWSTLFSSLLPAIRVLLYVLGVTSILLGCTVSAAMISDIIFLSTVHVFCLHHVTAFLHTNQLQALAALWRLFRGRKRNPLRRRLDTYECSLEQLVVGSLMFTPLLLLLPTTSVYHTLFSMVYLTLSGAQVVLYHLIALFHCLPFSLMATWIRSPKQFPTGVWFRFPELQACAENEHQGHHCLLSILGIRTASFAQLVTPFVRNLYVTSEWSSAATFAYKVVSGERYNLKFRLGNNVAALPQARTSPKDFAWLCYAAMASRT